MPLGIQLFQQITKPSAFRTTHGSSNPCGAPASAAAARTALAAAKRAGDLSAFNSASNASQISQALRTASPGPKPSTAAALAALQQLAKLHAAQGRTRQQSKAGQREQQQQAELAGKLLRQLAPGISMMSVG